MALAHAQTAAPLQQTDLGELYRGLSRQLERIVRYGVRAPEPLIEDACQFAWARLVDHHARLRTENVFAWLVRTATHEALKLLRRGHREQSLDAALDDGAELFATDLRPGPADLHEHHERLGALTALPPRQQRLLWLYGLGLSYGEIAVYDSCSPRTVERQLQRARARLRSAASG